MDTSAHKIQFADQDIKNKIFTIRDLQVMLDRDLAELYQVETRVLKQAVKRNIERFPDDFMFKLTDDEVAAMVSQFVIPSKQRLGGAKQSKPFTLVSESPFSQKPFLHIR